MDFNKHFQLKDKHAFLAPSSPAWLNYDQDKLLRVYANMEAAKQGVRLHAWAHETIELGIKQQDNGKTINMYINDAIGYRMTCEQILFATDDAFGTADTISFEDDFLRIHDYKSGVHDAKMEQLEIYAAYFCIEYDIRPFHIGMELRVYQNNRIVIHTPTPDEIFHIMDKTLHDSAILSAYRKG